jgi:hypothetical protein
MKAYPYLILVFLVSGYTRLVAQEHDTIDVTIKNYTYLVFDSNVSTTETGTEDEYDVDANKNIVSIQANSTVSKPTTLMVQTQTNLYVWIIRYRDKPKKFLYNFKPILVSDKKSEVAVVATNKQKPESVVVDKNVGGVATETKVSTSIDATQENKGMPNVIRLRINSNNRDSDIKSEKIQSKFNWILNDGRITYKDMADIEAGIYFTTYDIFLDGESIYFKLNVANTSSIPYDIDFVSFQVRHGKSMRSRESQSNQVIPPKNHESVKSVMPGTNETIVFSIQLFAFEESDRLKVKISELGGKRSLEFEVPSKILTNAKTIPL